MSVVVLFGGLFTYKYFAVKSITYNIRVINITAGGKNATKSVAKNKKPKEPKLKDPKVDMLARKNGGFICGVENRYYTIFNRLISKKYFNDFFQPPRRFPSEVVFG